MRLYAVHELPTDRLPSQKRAPRWRRLPDPLAPYRGSDIRADSEGSTGRLQAAEIGSKLHPISPCRRYSILYSCWIDVTRLAVQGAWVVGRDRRQPCRG